MITPLGKAAARPRIALVRGPGLSVFELQSYEPLLNDYELMAFGLSAHSIDTDTLKIPYKKLRWKDSIAGRSGLNAYRSRVKKQRYYMPGLERELEGFDLIHSSEISSTFSWQCALEKKKRSVPLVITSTENIRYPGWDDPVRSKLKKEIVESADLFFALTPDAKDVLLSEGAEPSRITVIPFGIDTERLRPSPAGDEWKKRFHVNDDDFVILFVGRIVWEKGIYDLASAVRQMNPTKLRLLFVGGGPDGQALRAFVENIGLAGVASCHPAIPYGQMENVYRLANVVVLPSLPTRGVREQFGLALAEAMACALPVVATRCGSMPWVIGDAGLLAESGSSSSIAACLDELRGSPQLCQELGAKGRRMAESRYNRNGVAENIKSRFRSLLPHETGTNTSFFVRVDDFPAWTETMEEFVPAREFEKFHAVLESHRIPYMLAVTPQPALRPLRCQDTETRQLTDEECALLKRIAAAGAVIGLHGVTHRSRLEKPHTEFIGMDEKGFEELIAYGDLEFQRLTGFRADVFVPPFNRITRDQLELLGRRFSVVCGGPETTSTVGHIAARRLSSGALYLPSYPPCYGRAHELLSAIDNVQTSPVCLTLHWEWERRRGYEELDRLCSALESRVRPWEELIRASRA